MRLVEGLEDLNETLKPTWDSSQNAHEQRRMQTSSQTHIRRRCCGDDVRFSVVLNAMDDIDLVVVFCHKFEVIAFNPLPSPLL
jgi:hypothetical protein